jgi:hypothetical protein
LTAIATPSLPRAESAVRCRRGTPAAHTLLAAAAVALTLGSTIATARGADAGPGLAPAPWQEVQTALPAPPFDDLPGLAAAPPTERDTPWWMAFDDATLNLLVLSTQQRQAGLAALRSTAGATAPAWQVDDARREAVASYLGARVLSARWLALNGVANAAARQQHLLATSTPTDPRAAAERTELLDRLALRREQVGQQQQALATERNRLLEVLATLCGMPAEQLAEMLSPVLAQPGVPSFASAVPSRLPRSILRARADVAAAEAAVLRQLRSGSGHPHEIVARMQPAGWIDAQAHAAPGAAPPPVTPGTAAETPELEEWHALLDHAAEEVTQDLRTLADRARLQSERARLADASRVAFLAARNRLSTGETSELQVLEQYQHLLSESDRYAAACGELAMAWLRLVASTGASDQVLVRR